MERKKGGSGMVSTLEQELASVMEEMPYGLYIVGSHSPDGEVNGMMADWVMQASFTPRLLAVSFENDAHSLANIRETHAFTVNLLGQDHEGMELARHFAQPYFDAKIIGRIRAATASVHHKLDGLANFRSASGCPVLESAIAWVGCQAEQFIPVGDHTLVIGKVSEGRVLREAEALTSTYTGWPYSG
jgi:flavin reductase (DIM6/NTAB) family NADH-FMN oxidoreductase RutF